MTVALHKGGIDDSLALTPLHAHDAPRRCHIHGEPRCSTARQRLPRRHGVGPRAVSIRPAALTPTGPNSTQLSRVSKGLDRIRSDQVWIRLRLWHRQTWPHWHERSTAVAAWHLDVKGVVVPGTLVVLRGAGGRNTGTRRTVEVMWCGVVVVGDVSPHLVGGPLRRRLDLRWCL